MPEELTTQNISKHPHTHLLSCAGAFRARRTQVWQGVLSPKGVAVVISDPLIERPA